MLMGDIVLNVHMNKCSNSTGKNVRHNYNMQNPTVKRNVRITVAFMRV